MIHSRPFVVCKAYLRRCRIAQLVLFAGTCLAALSCLGSDGPLPNILANENRTPAGRLHSGVLTLQLEVREGLWHPEAADGRALRVYSFAEQGHTAQTPGPLVRVPQGTELRVSVHNLLAEAVVVHGLHRHPGSAQDVMELAPGAIQELRFTAGEPGTYVYWASTAGGKSPRRSFSSADDIETRRPDEGMMSGAFIVDPPGSSADDRIFVIQLWGVHLFERSFQSVLSVNGKSWPHTERLHAHIGQTEHWRVVNASPLEHPMHLHGFYFHIDAVSEGEAEHNFTPAERRMAVTELVRSGHTFNMTWMPERAGNWLFHCHILDHMMGDYKAPWLYGPGGPPPMAAHAGEGNGNGNMGMGELVMGITVSDDNPRPLPVKTVTAPPAAGRDLFVRERPATRYVPAGPGFYLEGVSKEIGAAGPPLLITRGERTAVTVHNQLQEPTAIHWHGLEIESYYDGVPFWDGTAQHATPYIEPGSSFVAYMTPPRAGTFIYHSHWKDVDQLTGGMYGALLVLEPGQKYDPATDKVFVLGRSGPNEMRDPLAVNGSPQPGLMVLLTGQTYRFRFINITPNDRLLAASLVTEGHPVKWRAIAKDGADLPPQQAVVQDALQTISVGETYDYEFAPPAPGNYELRFFSDLGSEVTQTIAVVPRGSPFSAFAANR
jgi:FtsP/CotA-like multicopper oxidase with cupredoxin domain